jgi:hypothetical protein
VDYNHWWAADRRAGIFLDARNGPRDPRPVRGSNLSVWKAARWEAKHGGPIVAAQVTAEPRAEPPPTPPPPSPPRLPRPPTPAPEPDPADELAARTSEGERLTEGFTPGCRVRFRHWKPVDCGRSGTWSAWQLATPSGRRSFAPIRRATWASRTSTLIQRGGVLTRMPGHICQLAKHTR